MVTMLHAHARVVLSLGMEARLLQLMSAVVEKELSLPPTVHALLAQHYRQSQLSTVNPVSVSVVLQLPLVI